MSEIEAAELARLRDKYDTESQVDVEVRALIAALEKAQGEMDGAERLAYCTRICDLIAERDSARALLRSCVALVSNHEEVCSCGRCGVRARITAELEPKP